MYITSFVLHSNLREECRENSPLFHISEIQSSNERLYDLPEMTQLGKEFSLFTPVPFFPLYVLFSGCN